MDARTTIPAFDAFLSDSGLELSATVIGGAALQLLGVIERPTEDCDVLDPTLSSAVLEAAREFATAGGDLEPNWLNNGPASLLRSLPAGWNDRRRLIYTGRVIQLYTLGRDDLLRSKVFALVDRNIDLPDCIALAPTRDELRALLPWLDGQDGNPDWPAYVRTVLGQLTRELGYEL